VRRPLCMLGCVLLPLACIWASRGPAQEKLAPPRQAPSLAKFQFQGAGSCAAQACHNADAVAGFQGREYRIAFERDFSSERPRALDKHAQAYAILFDERSQRIVRNWKNIASNLPVHPEREDRCLRCHVHPEFDQVTSRVVEGVEQFRREDGVSCETCHGPAERWLATHFRPGWRELSASQRAALGMSDTRSALGRIRLCLPCHVGGPAADVDHDLIAAGHPWLKFEVGDYHSRWHKHWDSAKDKNPSADSRGRPDFEARLWLVGQIASAQAALQLLEARAGDVNRPWPEFAEFDCFACHQDLQAAQPRPARGGNAGAPTWNAWYTATLPRALAMPQLRQRNASWNSSRQQAAADAREAILDLQTLLMPWEHQNGDIVPVDALARNLLSEPGQQAADSWIEAAQWERAFAAFQRARVDLRLPPAPWSAQLSGLERLLRLPPDFDSPRNYDPRAVREVMKAMTAR
jgi:Cytochrome c554 and c-prime